MRHIEENRDSGRGSVNKSIQNGNEKSVFNQFRSFRKHSTCTNTTHKHTFNKYSDNHTHILKSKIAHQHNQSHIHTHTLIGLGYRKASVGRRFVQFVLRLVRNFRIITTHTQRNITDSHKHIHVHSTKRGYNKP